MRSVALGLPRPGALLVGGGIIIAFRCALWRWGFRDSSGSPAFERVTSFRCALWRWGFRDTINAVRKDGTMVFRCALWRWGFRDPEQPTS